MNGFSVCARIAASSWRKTAGVSIAAGCESRPPASETATEFDRISRELHDLFNELYTNSRTITVLTEDLESSDDLAVIAGRITSAMKTPVSINGNEIEVSLYVGVAAYPEDSGDGEALLMSAESAI